MAGVAGRSGRKPKPVARKLAAGNPGKRAINTQAPEFGTVVNIDPPDWMPEDSPGRSLWLHLAPLLCAQQILQATDIQNLEMYCAAYTRFREGEASILRDGITVAGAQGGLVKNPAATVINEAARQMATYGALLGLDPSSRQRLLGPKKKTAGADLAAILEM
ncbi:phage terminase small subunit P27 family [Bordetella sp. 15P40C-2]|uniref:phage terminase small subunit P27 family n=1 Tax=Bordetella sp. 15P40C-2 TaxID=2572246 RepID=UPI00132997B9|nr:phage terminase small subunit P27 family [Bordetella sp. 15P40C-2]MVW72144.1 phage terminase small subunit P27 family [Bordetella sp. 15P40C-2]